MPKAHKKNLFAFSLAVLSFGILFAIGKFVLPKLDTSFSIQNTEINTTFRESIQKITPNKGDILEVAQLESDETLTRVDSKSLFDNLFYLGTTISEIKLRVTYRYHIKLSEEWSVTPQGETLLIIAPQIRPSLPPAIHTDTMEKRSDEGWLRFNAKENMQKLEASLTPTLENMSLTPAKLLLVKSSAKMSVEEFVKKWILTQESWKESHFKSIQIAFPDDFPPQNKPQ